MAKVQTLLPKPLHRFFKKINYRMYEKLPCQESTLVAPTKRKGSDYMEFEQHGPENFDRTAIKNVDKREMKQTELSCRDRKRMESEDYMVMSFPLSKP